jgi:hypothetical protein
LTCFCGNKILRPGPRRGRLAEGRVFNDTLSLLRQLEQPTPEIK